MFLFLSNTFFIEFSFGFYDGSISHSGYNIKTFELASEEDSVECQAVGVSSLVH